GRSTQKQGLDLNPQAESSSEAKQGKDADEETRDIRRHSDRIRCHRRMGSQGALRGWHARPRTGGRQKARPRKGLPGTHLALRAQAPRIAASDLPVSRTAADSIQVLRLQ